MFVRTGIAALVSFSLIVSLWNQPAWSVTTRKELSQALEQGQTDQLHQFLTAKNINQPLHLRAQNGDRNHLPPLLWAAREGQLEKVKWLLAHGANPKILTIYGETAAQLAAFNGHAEIVELLINAGTDPLAIDTDGISLLHHAAYSGQLELVKKLVRLGLSVDQANIEGQTPASWAAIAGHVDILDFFAAQGWKPSEPFQADWFLDASPVTTAAVQGQVEVLNWLKAKGCDLGQVSSYDYTPIMLAAWHGHPAAVKFLIQAGQSSKKTDQLGNTLLMYAAHGGQLDLVKWLIESEKLDIHAQNADGQTALHFAGDAGREEIVRYLVSVGAEPDLTDQNGDHALFYAARQGQANLEAWLRQQTHFNLEQKNDKGYTALLEAAENGSLELVQQLIQAGANPFVRTDSNQSLFHLASISGNLELLKALEQEFDFSLADTTASGQTVMMLALEKGQPETLKWLIEQGGDLDEVNTSKQTLLDQASAAGQSQNVKQFIQTKAFDIADISQAATYALAAEELDLFDELMLLGAEAKLMARPLLIQAFQANDSQLAESLLEQNPSLRNLYPELAEEYFSIRMPGSIRLLELIKEISPQSLIQTDTLGHTPLVDFASLGALHVVKWLNEVAGVDLKNNPEQAQFALEAAVKKGHLPLVRYLVANGANTHKPNKDGRSVLLQAVQAGHLWLVRYFHEEHGLSLNQADSEGETALSLATEAGKLPVMNYMIAKGASIKQKNQHEETLVHQAFRSQNLRTLDYVLNELKLPLQQQESSEYWQLGITELTYQRGWIKKLIKLLPPTDNEQLIKTLASKNLDQELKYLLTQTQLNKKMRQEAYLEAVESGSANTATILYLPDLFETGQNPALIESLKRSHPNIAENLIKNHFEQMMLTEELSPSTVLNYAAKMGQIGILQLLFSQDASLKQEKAYITSPLYDAAANNQKKTVHYLLNKSDFQLNPESGSPETPLHAALEQGHLSLAKELLKLGADPKLTGSFEENSLFAALKSGRPKVLESWSGLTKLTLNVRNSDGESLIYQAVKNQSRPMLNWLLARNLSVNQATEFGRTPLMEAAKSGQTDIVETLLAHGANIKAVDSCKNGVLMYALDDNISLKMIQLLLDSGAPVTGKDCQGLDFRMLLNNQLEAEMISTQEFNQALALLNKKSRP